MTSRGDRREAIYEDDGDRARFLELLREVAGGFNWVVKAYRLMSNHHLALIWTSEPNYMTGIRQLSGLSTRRGSAAIRNAVCKGCSDSESFRSWPGVAASERATSST